MPKNIHAPLRRILGTPTALLIGMGVAIGSGIFRTPGDVAGPLGSSWLTALVWALGGFIMLLQGMVTAELATRFPQAGGEYVYLREAYGEFVAFFFGWAYTVFVIGGGAATIALAFGDFTCNLIGLDQAATDRYSGLFATTAIALVTGVNAIGLRAGAGTQNLLTSLKIVSLVAIVVAGFAFSSRAVMPATTEAAAPPSLTAGTFLAALLAVLWSYDGTTESVKMAEEIKDVRRALPFAVIGSAVALTVLYVAVNLALMRVVPPSEMAGLESVPGEAMSRLFGATGRTAILVVAMLVCLGSLSSTILATIRVTFALARDGLTFRCMARMSRSQAPVPALVVVAVFSTLLVLNRNFQQVLDIYFFASAFLFGLAYASLIVFRRREAEFPAHVYHCPFGVLQAILLVVIHLAIAVNIAIGSPRDAVYTAVLLAVFGALYFVWKLATRRGTS